MNEVKRLRFFAAVMRVRFSGEGRVVGSLVLVGADHAEATVGPAVVVSVDPAAGRELDVLDGLEWAVVEYGRAGALGFADAVD
jgi:hypothetical protein